MDRTTLDFDTLEAFLKFSANDFDYKKLASTTKVEWHGNLARIHVFFITNRPFKNATGIGLEVKANKLLLSFNLQNIKTETRTPPSIPSR